MPYSFIDILKISLIGKTIYITLKIYNRLAINNKTIIYFAGEHVGHCGYKAFINVHFRIIAFATLYLLILSHNYGKIDCFPPTIRGSESLKIHNLDCLNNGLLFSNMDNSRSKDKPNNYDKMTCRLLEEKQHTGFRYSLYYITIVKCNSKN